MSNVEITIDFKDKQGNPSTPAYFNSLPDWKSRLDNFVRLNNAEVVTTSDKMTLIVPYDPSEPPAIVKQKALADLGFASFPEPNYPEVSIQRKPLKSSGVNWVDMPSGYEVARFWQYAKSQTNTVAGNRSASVVGDWLNNSGFIIQKQANAIDYHRARILEDGGWLWISEEEYEPLEADIAIFEGPNGANGGHIQVFDGSQWVSDFRQPNFRPSGYTGNFYLYRCWDVVGETVAEGELFEMGSGSHRYQVFKDPRSGLSREMASFNDGRGSFDRKGWELAGIKHFAFPQMRQELLVDKNGKACSPGQRLCIYKGMQKAVAQMIADAKEAGIGLVIVSAFRSYNYQLGVFNERKGNIGGSDDNKEKQTLFTAAPMGFSEHSTGLAIDWGSTSGTRPTPRNPLSYNDTKLYRWLRDNAWRYGFVQTFTPKSAGATVSKDGVSVEGWHWMFVGTDISHKGRNISPPNRVYHFPADDVVKKFRRPLGADARSGR